MATIYSQSDLDALDRALGLGATEVRYADRTVVYRSVAEMLKTRRFIASQIGITQQPRQGAAEFHKEVGYWGYGIDPYYFY